MSPAPASTARGKGRVRSWYVPVLYVVLILAFGAGLWGSYRGVFPGKGLHRVNGVFVARMGEQMILVRHEPVPGVMDEMQSMLFYAESRDLLDRANLVSGDHVRFTLRQTPDHLLVVEIHRLP